MAFTPYGGNNEYDQDRLLKLISEYKDKHGDECEYVRCDHRNADHSILDKNQLRYYLYWRNELSKGRCLKSDRGYVKLRLCEIINSDMDPKDAMAELKLLLDNVSLHGTPESDIATTMFDYAVSRDLDLPRLWMGKSSMRSFLVTSEVMSYPAEPLDKVLMWYLSGGPAVHQDGVNVQEHVDLFNGCLREIDDFLFENTGKGIAETYSEGKITENYEVFKYMPYGKNKNYTVSFENLRTDGVFGEFMLGLFTYTRKMLCKKIGGRGPATPSSFNKEFRKIVEKISEEGVTEKDHAVIEKKKTARDSISSEEKALMEIGAELEKKCIGGDNPVPMLIINNDAEKQHVSPHMKSDIDRNWRIDVEDPQEYISSVFINPDYRSFKEEQRKFYSYWRGQCRKSRFGTTDKGYLWLYLCELANIVDDRKKILSQMVDLYHAYGSFDEERLIGHTCFDYAVLHKLPIPEPSIYESNITACLVMQQLLKGEDVSPDVDMLMFLARMEDKTISREFDSDCLGITCMFLKEANTMLSETGGIESHFSIEESEAVVKVFSDLKYFGMNNKVKVKYPNYIYSKPFGKDLETLMKRVHSAVRLKKTSRPVKSVKFDAFGTDGKSLLEKCVSEWYENVEIEEIKSRADNLVLDKAAIMGAESALKDVTDMMKIDEDKPEEQIEAKAQEKEVDKTWKGFSDALDDVQKGYLRSILDGKGKEYLKDNGLVQTKIEDAINALAMDAVGDTVLENGEAIEDYKDDLSSIL